MEYRTLGKTGLKVSRLGFGCLRLPETKNGEQNRVDDSRAIPLLRRAFELGVNYYDTGWGYVNGDSQRALGAAFHDVRDQVILVNKMPLYAVKKKDDFWYFLDQELQLMQTDYLDILMFHQVGERYWNLMLQHDFLELAQRAKEQGIIRHIGFSFHDRPEFMQTVIDSGIMEVVLCQYNLIDRTNEAMITKAHEQGLGVVTMGSVGAGNISAGGDAFLKLFPQSQAKTASELALRFVYGHPHVDCALSGMENLTMLEENVATMEHAASITPEETQSVRAKAAEIIAASPLSNLYCTACRYCDVCPKGIRPFMTIRPYLFWKVWGLKETALADYRQLGTDVWTGAKSTECINCGKCAKYCPQRIPIPEILREANEAFQAVL